MHHDKSARKLSNWAGKLKSEGRDRLPPLLFLTDKNRQPEPERVIARLPKGSGVILRDYDAPDRADTAARLARLCRRRSILFLVAGDAQLALSVRAHGLHLPEHQLHHRPPVRKPTWLVTAAAHSLPAIRKAAALGVDAALVSPIFPTESHPEARPVGVRRLASWIQQVDIPLYALGGIDPVRVRQLKGLGLAGIAGISGF